MSGAAIAPARLALAYAFDLVAGDPEWFPHPVRAIGAAIEAGERGLRRDGDSAAAETVKGAVLAGSVIAGAGAVAAAAQYGASRLPRPWPAFVGCALAWTTLATGNLLSEARSVLNALEAADLPLARTRLARIVGRDTHSLDESGIARAVIETLAESACDGIVAPLVWLALGGVPAAMAYKAANTLDSMIGHPEPPYRHFGHAAARLDDAANFVPARLTAASIVAAAWMTGGDARAAWRVWRRDGAKHASPNAGQSEAAIAGALGVRLGGLNTYDGQPARSAPLGAEGRSPRAADARRAVRLVAVGSALAFGAALSFCAWRGRKAGSVAR
jgi:adenosylcobinamide-phosphate synthase